MKGGVWYLLMLFDPPMQRNIISLGVATQWIKQKDGVGVAHIKKASTSIGHEQSMTVVHRIAKLESEHCIGIATDELVAKLCRR